ncbi:hypothetical protein PG994_015251 [Apiospora phragmitis]|uniref:ABC transporter family G domain-containing protein n=1 Tax=Apiospora phragmitis TaxID=2905665 RepID=A0ABR1SSQ7_9PEZI
MKPEPHLLQVNRTHGASVRGVAPQMPTRRLVNRLGCFQASLLAILLRFEPRLPLTPKSVSTTLDHYVALYARTISSCFPIDAVKIVFITCPVWWVPSSSVGKRPPRQNRDIPREEKLKYVDTIINLLELRVLADTLIGEVGAGLSVEQRKRVTIGVELVSRPSILIFLDEPTSGLDGQSAYNTVRFLRKLADVGQVVLVTIHQPSAQLFSQFDTLLLLAKGGKTVYCGDIGEHAKTVSNCFGRYGSPCPKEANPAEHMIDVVSGHLSQGKDWNEVWLNSPEHEAVEELDHLIFNAASKPPGTVDDGHEFAVSLWEQTKIVTQRMNLALYRNTNYVSR